MEALKLTEAQQRMIQSLAGTRGVILLRRDKSLDYVMAQAFYRECVLRGYTVIQIPISY